MDCFPGAGNQEAWGSMRCCTGAPSAITEQHITPKLSGAREKHFIMLTDCVEQGQQAQQAWLVSTVKCLWPRLGKLERLRVSLLTCRVSGRAERRMVFAGIVSWRLHGGPGVVRLLKWLLGLKEQVSQPTWWGLHGRWWHSLRGHTVSPSPYSIRQSGREPTRIHGGGPTLRGGISKNRQPSHPMIMLSEC